MKIKIALRANNPYAEEGYPIRGGKYASKFRKRTYEELEEQVEEFTMREHIAEKEDEAHAEAERERNERIREEEEMKRFAEELANRLC